MPGGNAVMPEPEVQPRESTPDIVYGPDGSVTIYAPPATGVGGDETPSKEN